MRALVMMVLCALAGRAVGGEHPEHPVPKKKEPAPAHEHPAGHHKEHPAGRQHEGHESAEHPRKQAEAAPPSQADIQKLYAGIVAGHVKEASGGGAYKVKDDVVGKDRLLGLSRIHKHKIVMLSEDEAFACSDFKTVRGGKDKLDIDFYVRRGPQGWKVSEVLIHKVNGKERFTYDADNKRVPVR